MADPGRRSMLHILAEAVTITALASILLPPDAWDATKRALLLGGVSLARSGSKALDRAQDRLLDAYRRETDR